MLHFACDYMEGAHPDILRRLAEVNMQPSAGYGADEFCEAAREKIRVACACPQAAVHFLVGGTQANAVVIAALLRPYQGVLSAASGHIAVHEAGAIELGGHKVLALPHEFGKLRAETVEAALRAWADDANRAHMVMPGMLYISQPTEYGTLYSLEELEALSRICRAHDIPLYVDGARLAYALASSENDATLADLARLADVFYIGGTKCGALLGEAVVIPDDNRMPHFFTVMKQHGALLAKGRVLGIQFEALFSDNLYQRIGTPAIEYAAQIRAALAGGGFKLYCDAPTNQVFLIVDDAAMARLAEQVEFSFWERVDASHCVIRLATSWATRGEDVQALLAVLRGIQGAAR